MTCQPEDWTIRDLRYLVDWAVGLVPVDRPDGNAWHVAYKALRDETDDRP